MNVFRNQCCCELHEPFWKPSLRCMLGAWANSDDTFLQINSIVRKTAAHTSAYLFRDEQLQPIAVIDAPGDANCLQIPDRYGWRSPIHIPFEVDKQESGELSLVHFQNSRRESNSKKAAPQVPLNVDDSIISLPAEVSPQRSQLCEASTSV